MDGVAFTVPGVPVPQGSKTIVPNAGTMRDANAKALKPWRATVTAEAVEAMAGRPPLAGPARLDVVFTFPRPRAHYSTGKRAGRLKPSAPIYCATRPDLDKLVRAVGDALIGVVLHDDAQLVEIVARKHYGSPAAHLELRRLV